MNCLANQEPHSEERFSCFSVNKMYWEEHEYEWKMLLNNNHTQKVAANGTKHKRHFVARGPTNYNQKKKVTSIGEHHSYRMTNMEPKTIWISEYLFLGGMEFIQYK